MLVDRSRLSLVSPVTRITITCLSDHVTTRFLIRNSLHGGRTIAGRYVTPGATSTKAADDKLFSTESMSMKLKIVRDFDRGYGEDPSYPYLACALNAMAQG